MDLKQTLDNIMNNSRRSSEQQGGFSPPPAGYGTSPPPAPAGGTYEFYAGSSPQPVSSSPPPPPPQQQQHHQQQHGSGKKNRGNNNNNNHHQHHQQQDTTGYNDPRAPLLTQPTIPGHDSTTELAIRTLPKLLTGNLIIVGDIHGCPDQFDDILRKTGYRLGVDCLVLAGDLVNKGPDSIKVIQRAIELNAFAVLGNHDYTLLQLHNEYRAGRLTADEAEEDPVAECAMRLPENCYRYLMGLPHILKIPQYNLMVIHAGVDVQRPKLADQKLWDLMHIRRILRDGTCIEKGDEGSLWARLWDGPETIVFGHDARTGFQEEEFAIGLDTGCVYGGTLSAVMYPGKKFVSVAGLPAKQRPKGERKRKNNKGGDSPSTLNQGGNATPAGMRLQANSEPFPSTPAGPVGGLVLANGKILTPSGLVESASGAEAQFPDGPPTESSIHSDPAIASASVKGTGFSIPAPRSSKNTGGTVSPSENNVMNMFNKATSSGTSSPQKTSSPLPTPNSKPPIAPPRMPKPVAASASPARGAEPSSSSSSLLLSQTRVDAIASLVLVKSAEGLVALLESPSFEDHWEDIVEDMAMDKKVWQDAVMLLVKHMSQESLGFAQDIVHTRDDVRGAVQDKALAVLEAAEAAGNLTLPARVIRATKIAMRPH